MKKFLIVAGCIIVLATIIHVFKTQAATVCFPFQGCTGTSTAPQAGQVLIGNASRTYNPAYLTASGTLSITTSSGAIVLTVTSSPALIFATGTAGTNFNIATSGATITFNCPDASGINRGCLTSSDWTTFNNKQAAGNYITALTGDGSASGPGSVGFTLATVNSNVGTFGTSTTIPIFTVNNKGLITAASTSATPFITLNSLSGTSPITYNTGTGAIGFTNPGFASSSITISSGGILSGGGDLTANRTISLSTSTLYGQFSATSPIVFSTSTGLMTCLTCVTSVTGSGNIASSGGTTPNITLTGVVPTANGGTNTSAWTAGSIVFATSTTQLGQNNSLLKWTNTSGAEHLNIGGVIANARLDVVAAADQSSLALRTTTFGYNLFTGYDEDGNGRIGMSPENSFWSARPSTAITTERNSPGFFLQRTYWNGSNSVSENMGFNHITLGGSAGSSAMWLFDNAGAATMAWANSGGQVAVGYGFPSSGNLATLGQFHTRSLASTTPTITAQGAANQTANLQNWQNSDGTVLTDITASGTVRLINNSSTLYIGGVSSKVGCLVMGAASGTPGTAVYVYFDSAAVMYSTTTKPTFCR